MVDELRIGVNRGGGPPPGYLWSVVLLGTAVRESLRFLNSEQYGFLAAQFRDLANEVDPTHSQTASIDAVEEFHELRERAGMLGGMNVRVFSMLTNRVDSLSSSVPSRSKTMDQLHLWTRFG